MSVKCDLAVDMSENFSGIDGVKREIVYGKYGVVREEIVLSEPFDEIANGMKRGRYITLTRGDTYKTSEDEKRYFISALSVSIKEVIKSAVKKETPSVLVIGLGNGFMTADALGKRVTEKIITTRRLGFNGKIPEISAFAVGVSGITGIESYEVVFGLASQISPDLIICVDALSAFKTERLGRAYQITDTGIRAGGGAGKPSDKKLDEETLKVPVIAVGVPFVISARQMFCGIGKEAEFDDFSAEEDMFVTLRDVDAMLGETSEVISSAINSALYTRGK